MTKALETSSTPCFKFRQMRRVFGPVQKAVTTHGHRGLPRLFAGTIDQDSVWFDRDQGRFAAMCVGYRR
ncbi:hypothetical protein KL86PLE_40997 [uncultured Pleomorphomonas sp.]|uniref:Uncharacterized protein n=1 Tax=uncultured Pleomorphomonas sp. TaxID=442121 RepID=A0A212LI07_9HYPH|nr:hypothetical protein KL86PLE_40997 [uncultured Pleomorphomonas sp.]